MAYDIKIVKEFEEEENPDLYYFFSQFEDDDLSEYYWHLSFRSGYDLSEFVDEVPPMPTDNECFKCIKEL